MTIGVSAEILSREEAVAALKPLIVEVLNDSHMSVDGLITHIYDNLSTKRLLLIRVGDPDD